MNILYIYSQIPLPLLDGGKKASFYSAYHLRQLGNKLTFLCLNDLHSFADLTMLEEIGEVYVIQHDKSITPFGAFRSIFSNKPYYISRFHKNEVLNQINSIYSQNHFDIVITESLHCAEYGIYIKNKYGTPIVLRSQNYETAILARFNKTIKDPIKKFYAFIEYLKLRRYESSTSALFDLVLMITEHDERKIKDLNPKIKSKIFPGGVDINYFASSRSNNEKGKKILWVGALSWPPNRDSLKWFVEDIFPLIVKHDQNIILEIVGSNPPNEFTKFNHPNIQFYSTVPDVRPFYDDCDVCVVPLRIGSGMRMKIVEMMAMSKAIVTSSIGCEGIPVLNGKHLLIADTPEYFAQQVIHVLNNKEERELLSKNAREFVELNYSWDVIVKQMNDMLFNIIKGN